MPGSSRALLVMSNDSWKVSSLRTGLKTTMSNTMHALTGYLRMHQRKCCDDVVWVVE